MRIRASFFLAVCAIPVALACVSDDQIMPAPGPSAAPPAAADPEIVAVDWLGRGSIYAAAVRERRGELTHVEYANGEREWVEASRIRPWPELTDQQVQVWTPRGAAQGMVIETSGFLVHIRFEDGAHTWFGRDQLYALQGAPPEIVAGAARPSFPLRRGVDPSQIRQGAKVLCYWLNAGELMPERPWTAEVLGIDGERVQLRYLYDDSLGTVNRKQILHVFEDVGVTSVGTRVWLSGTTTVGTIEERVGERYRVTAGGVEQLVAADAIIGVAPPVSAERLMPGTHVTVLWAGSTLYHGTVETLVGDQVTVAWHDGSAASAVPITDVLDTWEAAD